jgi:predicted RNA binding protein YcfA (HicA-like mRNA interferase family)
MTPRLPACTSRDVERVLLALGFVRHRQAGSHRIFYRQTDGRRVNLPMHSRDLKPGMLNQTIQDMGLSRTEFHALLLGKARGRRVA